ncbi:unnamed protein product, partial [Mesorhabditis belari]|uniref:Phosphotransferase n=1 Tax=Mesorhabditis belari TaxID=2138241 RepID=A0AAF3EKJ1_9BILA
MLLEKKKQKFDEITKDFLIDTDGLRKIMVLLEQAFDKGLAMETASSASVLMLPTYVQSIPDGTEQGEFLALDLGGTNFRIFFVKIINREMKVKSTTCCVPNDVMKATGEELFDYIAKCIAEFMKEHGLTKSKSLPLGFTFSFACKQDGLASARLIAWTKGFKASGVENEDVAELLRSACQRRGDINVDVVAVLNDTTATLMASAFERNSCQIAVIVGTGTNACYMEKLEKCGKLRKGIDFEEGTFDEMCINTEWGSFGDHGELDWLRTDFDQQVDEATINPGHQLFLKMTSGMYLGETVRAVLERLTREGVLFGGQTEGISKHGLFLTKYISEIESEFIENDGTFPKTLQILKVMGVEEVSQLDCIRVATICTLISTRAAHLIAAATATIIKRMGKPFVSIGVDGSVYRFHPTFSRLLDEKISELIDKNLKYELLLSIDGSGRGAALVAAVAMRMNKKFHC